MKIEKNQIKKENIKVIALDLDGTLTQHKSPLEPRNKEMLDRLAKQYTLLMAGAGQTGRIFKQMGNYPVDIIGNYGLQYAVYNKETGESEIKRDEYLPCDVASVEERATYIREKYGYTQFAGDSVEYHPSGCITLALLGTKAKQEDKLAFDPDRSKRRLFYEEVVELFSEFNVFVGGSSSFDMAPKPYNKYYALDLYCKEKGLSHENVLFIGDDYGMGGNDESVYLSDIPFLCVDDYREFADVAACLLKEEKEMNQHNICINKTAATITSLLGIESHEGAAAPIEQVLTAANEKFGEKGCDRVFMYNPDAIAAWIYEKYQADFAKMEAGTDLRLPMLSVMPSVTPVCFASMYTGMMPAQHGIQAYVKPVLTVETVFDDMVKAGKRAAIVSTAGDSISLIFLERKIDYFIYKTVEECNQKAMELIEADNYDLIVLYNADYDSIMHHVSPEGEEALKALRSDIAMYQKVQEAIEKHWTSHNTVLAFAPDHGCHKTGESTGNHGLDEPCDMHIMHFYSLIPGNK